MEFEWGLFFPCSDYVLCGMSDYSLGAGYKFYKNFRAELAYRRLDNLKYNTKIPIPAYPTILASYNQKLKLQTAMCNL